MDIARCVVLDTPIASFLYRKDARLAPYLNEFTTGESVLPFQVVAELRSGALLRNWGVSRTADLEAFVASFRVYPYDDGLCRHWADLTSFAKTAGCRLEAGDAWIAATALRLDAPLLTYDRDFARLTYPDLQVVCHA